MKINSKNFWAGVIGNALDKYDLAIFGLLAIYISPCFYPNDDQIVAIIKTFMANLISIITRPLGAAFFGRMAMNDGAKSTLGITLIGVSISTVMIGLIPCFHQIGFVSPLLLVLSRGLQGFFAAGETSVSAFFILRNTPKEKFTVTSSYYNFSTMVGVSLASFITYLVSKSENPNETWRYAFILGFFTGVLGIWLRSIVVGDLEERKINVNLNKIFFLISENRVTVLKIIFIASFSYVTYTVPFVFMNKFIPEISNIDYSEMIKYGTYLLVLNTLSIPILGHLAKYFNRSQFMGIVALITSITVVPLFILLPQSGITYVTIVRVWIVILGLLFQMPIQAWFYEQFSGNERYLLNGISYQIGSELIGRQSTAICLALWHYTQNTASPAYFVSALAIISAFILLTQQNNNQS